MDVNYIAPADAPTIDGVDGDTAWASAEGGGDDWRLLREATAPTEPYGHAFSLLWNENSLFVRMTNTNDVWSSNPETGAVDFGVDVFNLYFDPNQDGELNFDAGAGQGQSTGPNTTPDGYQLAFSVYDGFSQCGQNRTDDGDSGDDCSQGDGSTGNPIAQGNTGPGAVGSFVEGHIDNLFGNQSQWEGLRTSHIAMNVGASGAVAEIAIDWGDIDASMGGVGEDGDGLNANGAPANDDVWFLNAAAQTTDPLNFLPVWNWHTNPVDTEFFASRPHGEIKFVGRPDSVLGDFDGNGEWECLDVDALTADIAAGMNTAIYDMNGDNVVDEADLAEWLTVAGPQRGLAGPILVGDANLDGTVDGTDFLAWNTNKFSDPDIDAYCGGDFNASGFVDGQDFLEWNTNKFTSSGISPVPEPSSILMLLVGMGLALRVRRS